MFRATVLASLFLCTACDKTSLRNVASMQGHILGELTNAEKMIQSQLQGNPKLVDEELKLLHGAEAAARHNEEIEAKQPPQLRVLGASSAQLLQQGASEGFKKDASLLGMAQTQVEQLLHGHPVELRKEEQALNQAMLAVHDLSKPVAALVQTQVHQTNSASKMQTGVATFEQQRSNSMAAALQEKRNYVAAEDMLATEGSQMLSQFTSIKDAIAQAFAGKDSSAVKTAMAVGEMVDDAQTKQKEVTKLNRAEAAKTKREVATEQAAFAQMSAQSKEVQQQRAYTSGMARLASDNKAILGELSDLKTAVAHAYAGKNSKAVEDAMQVGELLDQARIQQKDVTKRDEEAASSARKLFQRLRIGPHQAMPLPTLIQKQGTSTFESVRATHSMRQQKLAASERKTLRETKVAEDAVKHFLASAHNAKASAVQHEVVDALEKAEHAEENALGDTGNVRRA